MTTPYPLSPRVTPEFLERLFEVPISFHRCLVSITGGVAPALMLSQAIWTSGDVEPVYEGWFIKSQDQWTHETGLSRSEQETARRVLREAGFLEERRTGIPARLWFRVRADRVSHALQMREAAHASPVPDHAQVRM